MAAYDEVEAIVVAQTGLTLDDYGVTADVLDQYDEAPEWLAECIAERVDEETLAKMLWGDDAPVVPVHVKRAFYEEYCEMLCPAAEYVRMIRDVEQKNEPEPEPLKPEEQRDMLRALMSMYKDGDIVALPSSRPAPDDVLWQLAAAVSEDAVRLDGEAVVAWFEREFAKLPA